MVSQIWKVIRLTFFFLYSASCIRLGLQSTFITNSKVAEETLFIYAIANVYIPSDVNSKVKSKREETSVKKISVLPPPPCLTITCFLAPSNEGRRINRGTKYVCWKEVPTVQRKVPGKLLNSVQVNLII